jgi:hypothetical protein
MFEAMAYVFEYRRTVTSAIIGFAYLTLISDSLSDAEQITTRLVVP